MPTFELSARARLRPLAEADAKELYELIEENRSHLQPWLPWAAEQTLDRTSEFIREAIKQEAEDDGFQVALVVDGRIAGVLGYHEIERKNRITTIGYWLAAEHQGGGLMTAAVACLTGHAFDEWRLNRVEIGVGPDNPRSRAIPERLGYREEGVLRSAERFDENDYRDLVLYAILASEWRQPPGPERD